MASVRLIADVGGPACRGCAYEPIWLTPAREPPVPLMLVPNLTTRARPPVTIDQRGGNCCFKFSAGSDMPFGRAGANSVAGFRSRRSVYSRRRDLVQLHVPTRTNPSPANSRSDGVLPSVMTAATSGTPSAASD